jgi:hypothetical protein
MKKILLLFSILGICSSLLAQAPQVTNVNASQIDGTKDVSINFDISAKEGVTDLNIEVWFKESPELSQWSQVKALFNEAGDLPLEANGNEDPVSYEWTTYSHKISGVAPTPVNMTITWRAGDDAPDINTPDAQIRIVAFYTKMDESGTYPLDASGQISGWDGFDHEGDSPGTGDPGTGDGGLSVYFLDDSQISNLTSGSIVASGNWVFSIYYDDINAVETVQIIAVMETFAGSGEWIEDQIAPQSFYLETPYNTGAAIDSFISEQALTPLAGSYSDEGTSADPGPGDEGLDSDGDGYPDDIDAEPYDPAIW